MERLLKLALTRNELFEYLIGKDDYEIRMQHVYMPTDTDMAAYLISKYLNSDSSFENSLLIEAMVRMSEEPEWSWLVIYYVSAFEKNRINFLPYPLLYQNIRNNKESLKKNNGWLCYNFEPEYTNLWDIIKDENTRLKEKYDLPNL